MNSISRNLEWSRVTFGNSIHLSRQPLGKVSIAVPEECIDRKLGKINLELFKQHIEDVVKGYTDVVIDYEIE